jgi:hypothetical protein
MFDFRIIENTFINLANSQPRDFGSRLLFTIDLV